MTKDEALRVGIDALTDAENIIFGNWGGNCDEYQEAIKVMENALAQPEIMREKLADSLKDFHHWTDLIRSGEAEVTSISIQRIKPQRPWVELSYDEIQKVIDVTPNQFPDYMMRFAWNLQQQLKEKNT